MGDDIVLKISTAPEQNTGTSLFVCLFVYLLTEWPELLSDSLVMGGVELWCANLSHAH